MELQQLKYFQTIARLEHMTRAAEALYVSQPSLSRAMARLEKEIGVPLFDREGRRLRLNQYGQAFLRRVEFAFDELEQGQRELDDMISPEHGLVTVSTLRVVGAQLLPGLLRAFRSRHPAIQVHLSQDSTPAMLKQLEEGEIDLCICSQPVEQEEIRWLPLKAEDLFLAVPSDHQFARRNSVQLSEVAHDAFISFKPEMSLRALADTLCERAGFEPEVVFEGEELTTVRGLVTAGLGIAIVPGLLWQGVTEPSPV